MLGSNDRYEDLVWGFGLGSEGIVSMLGSSA